MFCIGEVKGQMLISLVILRLELAKDSPELKYFRSYSAEKLRNRHQGSVTASSKTYASVASTGLSHKNHPSDSGPYSHCSGNRKQERHHSGRRSSEDCEDSGPSPRWDESHPGDSRTVHPHAADYSVLCDTKEKLAEANRVCRGQRELCDIYIELIDTEELAMSLEPGKQTASNSQSETATTSGNKDGRGEPDDVPENEVKEIGAVHFEPVETKRNRRQSESNEKSGENQATTSSLAGSVTRPKSHSPTGRMQTTINFFSGNPSVELTKGVLHIYKETQMTTLDKDVARSEMLCMLGVPASYTIHDLMKFIAPMGDCVVYMQVLRDTFPNQYMLLIKFRDQTSTDDFYSYFNNRPYNSIEPDICHLVYVARLEVINESEGGSLPLMDMTELPNCPVCLERMEESVDGILTVLCNHVFHSQCLVQWGDTSCPVCRYCQTPEEVEDQLCMQCGSHESLWICLICGNVGCGRYVGLHAYKHFQDTNHTYAMQLGTNRVWDYAGDNYVHRLAQNKSDGKLVEVDEGGNELREEKLDSITLEYTYLLTTQLESQRLYFMEKISEAVKDVEVKLSESTQRWEEERVEREKAECRLSELAKEKQALEKKYGQVSSKVNRVLSELEEERQINGCLRDNQKQWQVKVSTLEGQLKDISSKKDQEIGELQEQLRDIMFYLEAQQKLSQSPGVSQQELQEGQVIMGASATPSTSSGKKSRKKSSR